MDDRSQSRDNTRPVSPDVVTVDVSSKPPRTVSLFFKNIFFANETDKFLILASRSNGSAAVWSAAAVRESLRWRTARADGT